MAYIGKQPIVGNFVKLDAITTSATATYNLLNGGVAYYPQSANNCIVSLNGVIQSPTSAYTISGSTIVFSDALTSSDTIDFILVLGDVLSIGTPSDGTVTSAKLATGISGLISWQSVQTTGFTAVAGRGYPCNTTSAAFTVTLPSSATAGDTIVLVDYAGTFATNNLTLGRNGLKIEGGTTNKLLTTNREAVTLTYVDATQGWVSTSGANEGTQSIDPLAYSIDFLVVAGGGAGGGSVAGTGSGGGGAGGYRTSTQTVITGTVITVTVGDGAGSTATGETNGASGSNSSISGSGLTTITSAGGGGGAGGVSTGTGRNGIAGGSGGGAGGTGSATTGQTGGAGNTPSTSPSQGNSGGNVTSASGYGAGGGGAGSSAPNGGGSSSSGGSGTASSITGSSVTYSAGGGAGNNQPGSAGTANTGNGGAGAGQAFGGGAGGKGVVILSVPTANYSSTSTGSPTVTTSGSNTILKFTGSGSYTA